MLPDDFGALPATEPEEAAAEGFDFSREPEVLR